MTAQIVNNLQIKITNVHIRYEDTVTTGKPFTFGVTLDNLELYTTDMNWIKSYITEQVSRVYKIANLDSLAVYMNCNTEMYSALDESDMAEKFRSNIARIDNVPNSFTYSKSLHCLFLQKNKLIVLF